MGRKKSYGVFTAEGSPISDTSSLFLRALLYATTGPESSTRRPDVRGILTNRKARKPGSADPPDPALLRLLPLFLVG